VEIQTGEVAMDKLVMEKVLERSNELLEHE
jgi:hypothetical protein